MEKSKENEAYVVSIGRVCSNNIIGAQYGGCEWGGGEHHEEDAILGSEPNRMQ